MNIRQGTAKQDESETSTNSFSRFAVVHHIADEILSQIEQVLLEDPTIGSNARSCPLPREIEDSRDYLHAKIQHARESLRTLATELQVSFGRPDNRELVRVNLMLLFVLIESCRPERLTDAGVKLADQFRRTMKEKIDSLALDVINMREWLK